MEELWEKYAFYLTGNIGFNNRRWDRVVKNLHNICFYAVVPMDDNRIKDGIYERGGFLRSVGQDIYLFENRGASVLEVLVALIERIADEYIWTMDYNGDDMRWVIFEVFLRNLGLYPMISKEILRKNVTFWMDRSYDEDGKHSIMPLKYRKRGYNFMEIWSQVNIFLSEYDLKNWEDFEKFL